MSKNGLSKKLIERGFSKGGVTYYKEYSYCGRCPRLHGAYWKAKFKYDGRVVTMYVGLKSPIGLSKKKLLRLYKKRLSKKMDREVLL